jgi:GntR family transcriptional regulator, vanillate catabolism transcriptional regulator
VYDCTPPDDRESVDMPDSKARPRLRPPSHVSRPVYRAETEDLNRQVHRIFKTMIVNGDLRSGEKLVLDDLAVRLGVSRTPLQFALTKLEQENLIETTRRGFYVRRHSRESLLHIYDIRCRLEPLAARGAALNATDDEIAGLGERLRLFDAAAADGDPKLLKRTDYEFHMDLLRCCGNPFLYDMLATYNIIIISNTKGLLKPAEMSVREHHSLLDALRLRDADKAEASMLEHVAGSRDNLSCSDEYLVEGLAEQPAS